MPTAPAGDQSAAPASPAGSQVRRTLVRVLLVQVVALAALAALQRAFTP